ncbi:aldose 1-epimerase family protein [Erysipelothrix sp. HDW6C]|uniref:aldose 1-epimerase family protein n=1 Tax=Erysipelothrix sp. HDW6C TaxID=2714930 RepID=UPI001407C441|nr:aldose 1-epimerase family protein [Erysipelothrix sp. HDW6C]QIK69611.1 aldose 1-epimerase family protein [Erysipelothrix sp. HDW6C]
MIKLENEHLLVTIAEHGAEIVSVYNKVTKKEMMWSGDTKYWGRVSPVLFPIVGRVINGSYRIDDTSYQLSQHGFLRDQDFTVKTHDATHAVLRFESQGQLKDKYPFEHAVEIEYRLDADTIHIGWHVFNLDTQEMYYSIGAHPAFALTPDDNYEFRFKTRGPVDEITLKGGHVDQQVPIEVEPIPVEFERFSNDALIYTNVDAVDLVNLKTGETVRAEFAGFDYVGLWTPVVDGELAPFICIEPWLGITDRFDATGDFKEKLAIKTLERGADITHRYSLRFI